MNAFSELRLTSSNLQTTFLAENVSEDGKIKIYVSKQDPSASPTSAGNPVEIEIDLAEIMGGDFYKEILWESDLKGRLNEFFSLQKSDSILLSEIKGSVVGSGRSIMNTLGLYVVDSTYNSDTKKYSIRFGCDPKRLQDYVQGDNGDPSGLYYELCDAEGSNVTYMRISGEIKPSATLGEAGILIGTDTFFPAEMVYTLYETATERDNVLSDFRKNHPILESVLTYTSFDVEDANDASKTKYGVSVSGTDVTISNSVAQLVISKTEGDSTTSDTYIVNTENCHNLSSLANAIRDAYVSGIKDVQVVNGKLVFTTDVDVTVKLEGTPLDAEKGDFKIKGHDPIDFQDLKKGSEVLTLSGSTTIYDVVAAVNQELDESGVSLYYNDTEGNAAYSSCRNFAKSLKSLADSGVVATGERLRKIFAENADPTRLNQDQSTGTFTNLINTLKEIGDDKLSACGFKPWLENLESKHNEYLTAVQNRNKEIASKVADANKVYRERCLEGFGIVTTLAIGKATLDKDEGCIQFINAVNSHIDQKKVHLKLRKGKGKNTTESPETTVVDFPTETKEEENAA